MRRAILSLLMAAAAASALACGAGVSPSDPTSVTAGSEIAEVFTGSLDKQGSSFYSFPVATAGPVNVTLVSLSTSTSGRPPQTAVMRLGFGVPAGTACEVTATAAASPALQAQFTRQSAAGTFCVEIRDIGNLTGTTTFVVRIAHT